MKTHILGFSRIGLKRELKFFTEKYWNNDNNYDEKKLLQLKNKICENNWKKQINIGLDYITVGDFSFYDQILDNLLYFNIIPNRFNFSYKNFSLEKYFEIARGVGENKPLEMRKWFNTNYHYLVPEYTLSINFKCNHLLLSEDIKKAKLLNHPIKVVLIGPLSLLKIGKIKDNKLRSKILLLPNLLLLYIEFLTQINKLNVELIQIDEPILSLDISEVWTKAFESSYILICSYFNNIILTTYFGEIEDKFEILKNLPLKGLHIDITNNNQIDFFKNNFPKDKILSLGVINGKNIWINNLEKSFYILQDVKRFIKEVWISTSCSLIHNPIDIDIEQNINKNIKNWISFGLQKIKEIVILKKLFNKNNKIPKYFFKNIFFVEEKKKSNLIFNLKIRKELKILNNLSFSYRKEIYNIREKKQSEYLKLPIFPITTIGSFPQTKKIRKLRSDYKNNIVKEFEYKEKIKEEIKLIIKKQEKYDLDVFTHGEPERNDMVEYFAELLNGFLVTNFGWVQSYGTRCIKTPIIYGDVFLLEDNLTVYWIKFAQSLTNKYVKGMLTGPITMFKWSFSRDDQPDYITSLQISLVLKKEVLKLEESNIKIIQIDEPALRECLPLRKKNFNKYFNWSSKIFLLSCNKIKSETQIHTHICYSEFKKILNYIIKLDVDVISIETARSDMEILPFIRNYPNGVGLGLYDIHSKKKLKIDYALYLIKLIVSYIPEKKIWVNPDCGLKTRNWTEVDKSLNNIVKVTKFIRGLYI